MLCFSCVSDTLLGGRIKYHNIRGLFTHQVKEYCNDINGCRDNRRRVDDNIRLHLSEQEITALLWISGAQKTTTNVQAVNGEMQMSPFLERCTFSATHEHAHLKLRNPVQQTASSPDVKAVALHDV